MFGGIGWMVNGNMAAGAHSDGRLMIRCSREDWEGFVSQPGAGAMLRGGKGMVGWVLVDPDAILDDQALGMWVARGRAFAESLPPKR